MGSPGHQDLNASTCIPKTAALNSAAATITAVSAVGARKIRVLAMKYSVDGAGTLVFKDGTTGDELGRITYGAAAVDEWAYNPDGWFDCSVATDFVILNSSTVTVAGTIRYITLG